MSDNHQRLCFSLALWNERDPFLKERLYGLTNSQGNHGESERLIFTGDSDDTIDASVGSEGNNRIYAGSGDDTLILGKGDRAFGGEGSDRFFVISGGDNIITGGADPDRFWIVNAEIPEAANIITDFMSEEDVIGIAGLSIGFDDLSITQQGDDVLIAANGSDLAVLQGIDALVLTEDDFAFA